MYICQSTDLMYIWLAKYQIANIATKSPFSPGGPGNPCIPADPV